MPSIECMMQDKVEAMLWLHLECRISCRPESGWGLLSACKAAAYASAASFCLSVVMLLSRASCNHDAQPVWGTSCGCQVLSGHTAEHASEYISSNGQCLFDQ